MKRAVLATALALVGCTSFQPVEPGECGNSVLEVGEDCDGFAALGENTACAPAEDANACFYVCTGSASCPEGWGCGTDGRCRRASGAFVIGDGSPWRFAVDNFDIGDVDGDGNADLIGNDVQTITVRYGSPDGTFVQTLEFLTRTPAGPPTFGHFDDDGRTDVVVPIDLGLFVLLGTDARTLEPVAYAPLTWVTPSRRSLSSVLTCSPISRRSCSFSIATPTGCFSSATRMLVNRFSFPPVQLRRCSGRCPARIFAELAPPPDREEWALAVPTKRSVAVYEMVGDSPDEARPQLVSTVSVPGAIHLGATFGDADGDGDADLLVSFKDDLLGRSRVAVAANNGGTLAAAAVYLPAFDRQSDASTPWPLAVGDFSGDGKLDYVMRDVVVIAAAGVGMPVTQDQLIPTANPLVGTWSGATTGDFNGDGVLDFAAATEGLDGIDVFLSAGGLFSRFHTGTNNPPAVLRGADYDGDFVDDVAFVSKAQLDGERDELQVMFGQHSAGPTEPIAMGQFDIINTLDPVDGIGIGADLAADLIVVSTNRSRVASDRADGRQLLPPHDLAVYPRR